MFTHTRIILSYIDAINEGDVDKLSDLMSNDHLFIDSNNNRVEGKEAMKKSWTECFAQFPDYKIEIQDVLENDRLICILGYASGTYKPLANDKNSNYRKVPAAWSAIVEDDTVKQWQVYGNNILPNEHADTTM